MTNDATLIVDIVSYWHIGTGRGSGSHLDAVIDTDHNGLPFVPGRHLKGLLRDAVYRAEHWGLLSNWPKPTPELQTTWTEALFGRRNTEPESRVPRDETTSGALRVSDAVLPTSIRTWLTHPSTSSQKKNLVRTMHSTAIEASDGVAKTGSLRGIQVAIPMPLEATLHAFTESTEPKSDVTVTSHWIKIISHCLPLLQGIGSQRTRGLGRTRFELRTEVSL